MLRVSFRALGGFVIYPRVVADWRQFMARDDAHSEAKSRLDELLEHPNELTPTEADRLLDVFMRSHNADGATKLIRMMREDRSFPLLPPHYHAMLRVFNFDRDKSNLETLYRIAFDRGCSTQETFALAIDSIHALAPRDATSRVLGIVEAAHTAFEGSLACEVAHSGTCARKRLHAPILTSLLHHVTHDAQFAAYLPIVIAVWIQSLGVSLSDWDYVNIISAIVAKSEAFPVVRRVVGHFDDAPLHHVKLSSLIGRILERGEPSKATVAVLETVQKLNAKNKANQDELLIHSGIVNTRITYLPKFIDTLLSKAVLGEQALGPTQSNAFPTVHSAALVLSTLRHDSAAVATLSLAHRLHQRWMLRYMEHAGPNPADGDDHEPLAPHAHYLIDIGNLFSKCSDKVLQTVSVPFATLAETVASTALDTEVAQCGAVALLLIRTNEEARQAWQHIVASVDSDATRVPFSVRTLTKKFLELCCRNPALKNAKLTDKGYSERERWGRYLEARDTSLALFGQVRQAKDVMRHLFFNNGAQQPLRSEEMCKKDILDMSELFGVSEDLVKLVEKRERLTEPLLRCGTTVVPKHLFDPTVVNTFPHKRLRQSSSARRTPSTPSIESSELTSSGCDQSRITEDFFPQVWTALMRSSTGLGAGQWYLKDPEMYMLLLHGLIQRLDWEAAVQLTLRATPNFDVTFLMDQEIQQYFDEIGDPVGSLAFKTATKLYDARIQPNVASKRAMFHSQMAAEEGA